MYFSWIVKLHCQDITGIPQVINTFFNHSTPFVLIALSINIILIIYATSFWILFSSLYLEISKGVSKFTFFLNINNYHKQRIFLYLLFHLFKNCNIFNIFQSLHTEVYKDLHFSDFYISLTVHTMLHTLSIIWISIIPSAKEQILFSKKNLIFFQYQLYHMAIKNLFFLDILFHCS